MAARTVSGHHPQTRATCQDICNILFLSWSHCAIASYIHSSSAPTHLCLPRTNPIYMISCRHIIPFLITTNAFAIVMGIEHLVPNVKQNICFKPAFPQSLLFLSPSSEQAQISHPDFYNKLTPSPMHDLRSTGSSFRCCLRLDLLFILLDAVSLLLFLGWLSSSFDWNISLSFK